MKPLVLLGTAVVGAAGLLAGSQTWVSFALDGASATETVTGHEVNAALTPIFIALIAAALALTIAGPVFRRILGALVALLGAGATALTIGVLANPLAALSGRITELTGISGDRSTAAVSALEVAFWGYLSAAAGAAAVVLGLVVLITSGRWAAAGRKYDGAEAPKRSGGAPDRISDWDALSEGGDPTDSDGPNPSA